jgi:hypothetical protein
MTCIFASPAAVHLMVPNQVIVLATPQKITCLEPANLKPYRRFVDSVQLPIIYPHSAMPIMADAEGG